MGDGLMLSPLIAQNYNFVIEMNVARLYQNASHLRVFYIYIQSTCGIAGQILKSGQRANATRLP